MLLVVVPLHGREPNAGPRLSEESSDAGCMVGIAAARRRAIATHGNMVIARRRPKLNWSW